MDNSDAIEWISAHGSERLRMGVAAGMLGYMATVYHEERIAYEMGPEWEHVTCHHDVSDALNPLLPELRALIDEQANHPGARLVSTRPARMTAWRRAIIAPLPWCKNRHAIRLIGGAK